MALLGGSDRPSARTRLLAGATALACLCAFGVVGAGIAHAQNLPDLASAAPGNGQMLLEADTLIYDNDRQTVTAAGNVQIDYDGNRMVARRVIYNQQTGRLVAVGDVAVVEKDGNRIFADELDVTDDFRDGFINALRVEAIDKTYFAAESAERRGGTLTTFNNGVYTACEPCEDNPESAPIWRIKARKIIWNGQSKTVRFERARFEFFGLPLAMLPVFEMPDPSVKRKSGFLFPTIGYNDELGAKVSVPYFFALSPTYDVLFSTTYFTKQGFLAELDWRQRLNNGSYFVKVAGIRQQDPSAFDPDTLDRLVKSRFMLGTKGEFSINPRWSFGWDVLLQTDANFSRSYQLGDFRGTRRADNIYLTGLNERNYFDLRFYRFYRQEDFEPGDRDARGGQQPWVLPSLDYDYTVDEPVGGGQLSFGMNTQLIHRYEVDYNNSSPALRGVEGTNGRITGEAEWKRNFVMPGGLVVTPILGARADAIGMSISELSERRMELMATRLTGSRYTHDNSIYGQVATDIRSSYYRAMATAGMEVRWPVLFSTSSASHVLEPMAQLFIRPDAAHQSTLGIPNEDAQSLVFSAASLFERDKFSGYDRIEGGTRANLGIRYSGNLGGGWTATGIFGQSYHLAGDNPYAQPDLVNVGAFSGLETDVSDFVGLASLTVPNGMIFSVAGRFDEETFEIRRAETQVSMPFDWGSLGMNYTYIQAQPLYGFTADRQEVSVRGSLRMHQNWSVFGQATYDLVSETLAMSSAGMRFADECFSLQMEFTRRQRTTSKTVDYNISVSLTLRTLGEFGTTLNEVDSYTD